MKSTGIPASKRRITPIQRWFSKRRSHYLQISLPSAIRNQFCSAIYAIEFIADALPENTIDEFEREFAAIEQLQFVGRLLKHSGRVIVSKNRPQDERWFHKIRQDLFDGLSPSIRDLLMQQGLTL